MKTDVREHENHYELDVDLPGFSKEELKLSVPKQEPQKPAPPEKKAIDIEGISDGSNRLWMPDK